jgi:glutathione S-transferase
LARPTRAWGIRAPGARGCGRAVRGRGPPGRGRHEGHDRASGRSWDQAFAPPVLADGDLLISQTANILQYLAPKLGLASGDEVGRLAANALQLTLADLVDEAHNTHHPLAPHLYYEDQKEAAKLYTGHFLSHRMGKYLGYFEGVVSGDGFLVGGAHAYPDLSMFQVLEGLNYAFPRAMSDWCRRYPALARLGERVRARPRLAAYLGSPRRLAFNETGIFRHYPELDQDPA